MQLTPEVLQQFAKSAVNKLVQIDPSIMAAYQCGSTVLDGSPLLGGTTDIDLVLIHTMEPSVEREILRRADSVVHKMPDEAWKNLTDIFQLDCPGFAVMSYPHPNFQQVRGTKSVGNPPHVVYAGGVIPYHIAVERGHINHVFDNLIHLAAKDSFELSIYVNQNAREMPWHQHSRYFEFEKQNPYFHFKKGLPYHQGRHQHTFLRFAVSELACHYRNSCHPHQ